MTTDQLVAYLRRADREALRRYLEYGRSPEQLAEDRAEDAAYFAQRRAEFESVNREGEEALADERIFERMRAQDRAFD